MSPYKRLIDRQMEDVSAASSLFKPRTTSSTSAPLVSKPQPTPSIDASIKNVNGWSKTRIESNMRRRLTTNRTLAGSSFMSAVETKAQLLSAA